MLRIAIQSKGRMCQESLDLLDSVGVKLVLRESNPLLVRSSNFPAEVLFIEKDRIPDRCFGHNGLGRFPTVLRKEG